VGWTSTTNNAPPTHLEKTLRCSHWNKGFFLGIFGTALTNGWVMHKFIHPGTEHGVFTEQVMSAFPV
jgi:hypothetical protein